ncbi:MAG: Trk system potassium transporter TrkA [Haloferacaceae archaeon]
MRVIVIGAGQVGESIAADLAADHEVMVVERDPDRVEELTYDLDVLAVQGDGTSLSTLEEVGVADADMVIASTDIDETNIVACSTVAAISDAFTVARVKQTGYLETWQRSRHAFGVGLMVCTNLLAAKEIVRVVGLPAARDVEPFAGGLVQMAEFEVTEESEVAGHTVREADRYDALTFVGLFRGDEVVIPRGETRIRSGDRLVVVGPPETVRGFAGTVANDEDQKGVDEVVVVGGSEIGYHVASSFAERGIDVRMIEHDPERARQIAEDLPDVVVLESDATDPAFLEREHVGDADVVVSALASDERNLLACLLAKRAGVGRAVSVVDTYHYIEVFEAVGVDVAVSPRRTVAEEITRLTRAGGAENVAILEDDRAEVIEVEIAEESPLAGRPIRESVADLPNEVVIGAIARGDELVVPRGDTVVEAGDHVVAFTAAACADDLAAAL